jgi:hypothetical protein
VRRYFSVGLQERQIERSTETTLCTVEDCRNGRSSGNRRDEKNRIYGSWYRVEI